MDNLKIQNEVNLFISGHVSLVISVRLITEGSMVIVRRRSIASVISPISPGLYNGSRDHHDIGRCCIRSTVESKQRRNRVAQRVR